MFDEDNYYTVEPKNQVEWTNLIGRDTVLSLVEISVSLSTPALLCLKESAQGSQSLLLEAFLAFRCVFMA